MDAPTDDTWIFDLRMHSGIVLTLSLTLNLFPQTLLYCEVRGMRSIFMVLLVSVLGLAGTMAFGATPDYIGIVKAFAGEVDISRGGRTIRAEPNMKLLEGDVVQTGPNGKAGLILEDDTVISMGRNSRIAIKSFMFQPNEKKLSFIARVIQGTASFLSGQIAKLAPKQVHIETPHATIGIRGTHLLIRVD